MIKTSCRNFEVAETIIQRFKSENIPLDSKGNAVITDFGLAKLNMTNYKKIILRYSRILSSSNPNPLFQLHIESRLNNCYLV